jgi:MFS family permease
MFETKKTTWLFYIFVFLFTLHITPVVYINSNFLGQYLSTTYVSLVYGLASLGTILSILLLRDRLKRFGNYKVFIGCLIIEIFALLLLILSDSMIPAVISFIALFIVQTITFINLDIFLEKHTQNEITGKIRGWYFTAMNIAFILGPFLSSLFLSNNDFKQVYIFTLVLVFPIIFLASELFSDFEDSAYDKIKIFSSIRRIRKNTDVYATIMSDFILRFFYAWMIIYTPIYLYQYQHFSLSEVTLILSIALIPFVLIQSFAGDLADKRFGEKEMLTIGFIVMAFFTATMSFIDSSNISVWIAILFMTRVGASMIEIMTETHLFKRVDSSDINIISIYRITRPVAYIFGALLGTFFLYIISFNMIFFILGGIVLYGIRYSLSITDTR